MSGSAAEDDFAGHGPGFSQTQGVGGAGEWEPGRHLRGDVSLGHGLQDLGEVMAEPGTEPLSSRVAALS